MDNIRKDASLYLLTGLFQLTEENSIELLENMVCAVKEDQCSISSDDPEKEHMDKIFNESLRLLNTVSIFITNSNSS